MSARATAVAARREALRALPLDPEASVVLFGSWGRGELTRRSDDDWALLVDGPERAGVEPEPEALAAALGLEGTRGPGRSGVFGGRIFCADLLSRIGLDADSNANLTRRMLLMLESQPVAGDAIHRRCWERVLDGYLEDADRPYRPPRFFLNDLIRYWRTICVDFVGKEREDGEKWGIRNAKLRTSRKVLFAAGLVPLLQTHRFGREERRDFLAAQLAAPATDRLAAAFLDCDARDAGVRALSAYDRWLGVLDDPERARRARGAHEGDRPRVARLPRRAPPRDRARTAACSCCCSTRRCSRTCASTASSEPAAPRLGGGRRQDSDRRYSRPSCTRLRSRSSAESGMPVRSWNSARMAARSRVPSSSCSSTRAAASCMCTVA